MSKNRPKGGTERQRRDAGGGTDAETRCLLRIAGRGFVAGAVVEGGSVVRAAPIIRYLVGMSAREVRAQARSRGWEVETL